MQHELQVGLEKNKKCIAGRLAILRKWLHDEVERAKNLKDNISSLQIKGQKLQEQEHMINRVLSCLLITGLTLSCCDVY